MTFILDAARIKEHQQKMIELIGKRSYGPIRDFLMKNKYPPLEGMGLYVMALIKLAAIISRDHCKNKKEAFLFICELEAGTAFGRTKEEEKMLDEAAKNISGDSTKQ